MTLDIGVLATDTPNSAILDSIHGVASTDYQRRIPRADVAGVKGTIDNLTDPANRRWMNEFIDVLVNRIGMTIARSTSWKNPLSPFKKGMLGYGSTIEEIQVGLLEAHTYDPDRDYMEKTLFSRELPEVQVNFHTVNRQNFYKITINDAMLRRAFLTPDGLSGFINQLMEAPANSDEWDEFLITCSLFREYESNGGFFKVQVPDISDLDSNSADAKIALRKMRAMAGNLGFLSTEFNAAKMPVFAKPEDLYLFVTPEFNAAMDVEALAGAFNIDRASLHGKIIQLPQAMFGITGCQAIMTTEDFFVIADTLFETRSIENPASLHHTYFLHHHQVISASRFVPAIMFTTDNGDEAAVVNPTVTSVTAITIEPQDGEAVTNIQAGGVIALKAMAVTDPAMGEDDAATAVTWAVTGAQSPRTFITQHGNLHAGPDETAASLTVHAYSALVDADNPRKDPATASRVVPLDGGSVEGWPEQGGGPSAIVISGFEVEGVTPGDFAYDLVVPADTVVEKRKVEVNTIGSADVEVSTVKVGDTGYTVTVSVDNGVGDPDDYVVNVTFG